MHNFLVLATRMFLLVFLQRNYVIQQGCMMLYEEISLEPHIYTLEFLKAGGSRDSEELSNLTF